MADHAEEQYDEFDDLEYEELEAKRSKPKYSKVVVAVCLVACIAYTVTCFVFLWNGKQLNDVQTICFYGCFGIEFASLAFITRGEYKYVGANPANKQMPHIELKERDDE